MVNRYCKRSREGKVWCGVVVMRLNFPAEIREVSNSCAGPKGEIEHPANIPHQAPFPPYRVPFPKPTVRAERSTVMLPPALV